jgi:beta-N-acetylhexosaminidase
MISHGGFPEINLESGVAGGLIEPASLNFGIATELLREELGFKHLVVTDDLEMGAISRHCEIEDAARRAFWRAMTCS